MRTKKISPKLGMNMNGIVHTKTEAQALQARMRAIIKAQGTGHTGIKKNSRNGMFFVYGRLDVD